MYGSWYWGSQASSWIFWWAFARLCRLTSTPHGRGRDSVGAVAGRWAVRQRVLDSSKSQDGAGVEDPSTGGGGTRCGAPTPCSSWHGSQRLAGPRVVSI